MFRYLLYAIAAASLLQPLTPSQAAMPIPADNQPDARKAAIGQMLFFDTRTSQNNSVSCSLCHSPKTGWTVPTNVAQGLLNANGTRRTGIRNSPTILNAANELTQFWDGISPAGLEDQAWRPLQNPVEHGQQTPQQVVDRLNQTGYRTLFQQVGYPGVTEAGVAACLAQFERLIVCNDTNWQRRVRGESWPDIAIDLGQDLSKQRRGEAVFFKYNCQACHKGEDLADGQFHNIGAEFFSRKGNLTNADVGRQGVSGDDADLRAFKTPRLIGVALTAPFMHNGSFPTLRSVIEAKDQGFVVTQRDGRRVIDPNQDPRVRPLGMTTQEKDDLEAFLTYATLPRDYPYYTQPALPGNLPRSTR